MRKPRHVAIVMDGNGRWAKQRHRPRSFGHRAGQKAVRKVIEACVRCGIEALTLFAFSSENWSPPTGRSRCADGAFLKGGPRGRRAARQRRAHPLHRRTRRIATALRERMHAAMVKTQANTKLALNIAVNYGGRWDIAHAARAAAAALQRGEIALADIDEKRLAGYFFLADMPPLDLFIRTGGERRVSNFLLWQVAYSELYFSDVLWPDFDAACLDAALVDFAGRERRYGRNVGHPTMLAPLIDDDGDGQLRSRRR